MLQFPINSVVVLDLDDTIYKEVDFLISAYRHIAKLLEPEIGRNIFDEMISLYRQKQSTFDVIKEKYDFQMSVDDMVETYRFHSPQITLSKETKNWLERLKNTVPGLALITDGRSVSQRNKLKSLFIEDFFDKIIISEEFGSSKPAIENYKAVQDHFIGNSCFIYIGDNPSKDFLAPNKLNWESVCLLDDGRNIHTQALTQNPEYSPKHFVKSLTEIHFG